MTMTARELDRLLGVPRSRRESAFQRYEEPEAHRLCVGRWPDFCYAVWPVSRFAWCVRCREHVPSKNGKR